MLSPSVCSGLRGSPGPSLLLLSGELGLPYPYPRQLVMCKAAVHNCTASKANFLLLSCQETEALVSQAHRFQLGSLNPGVAGSLRTPPCLQTQLLQDICNAKDKATSREEQTRDGAGRGFSASGKDRTPCF